ncbi:hypothetical protein NDU88_002108 [Pleurodeles waltl]|uniref:Uncharacterized protein n=1 Tax=Pleurodeles waltl TaxID=8319 RepID=A0AAV7U8C6_PLEWA|nr:hypothetical protein NDU88_002108 [Pleurodeles waltl]
MQPGPAWVERPLWNEGRFPLLGPGVGTGMPVEGRGGRVLSLPPLGSARNALERRSRSSAMAAASSRDHRVLRVGRAFRGAVLPELLIMPGSDCAVIPGALGHSRAQDFGVTVGRERSSTIKLPLRPPSWPRPTTEAYITLLYGTALLTSKKSKSP